MIYMVLGLISLGQWGVKKCLKKKKKPRLRLCWRCTSSQKLSLSDKQLNEEAAGVGVGGGCHLSRGSYRGSPRLQSLEGVDMSAHTVNIYTQQGEEGLAIPMDLRHQCV